MTSCWVNWSCCEGLDCLVGARKLQTAGAHAEERLSLALRVLVREGGMGGVGGTEHAAKYG